VGSGIGLNEGWGTPDYRVFGMVGYSPGEKTEEEPPPVVEVAQTRLDTDGDGYFDDEDGCPEEPEDFDEIEDEDGCPEDDVDGDGILDADDECVFEPEDIDGWVDSDGCPDPDNDADNVPDESDDCRGVDGDVLAEVQEVWNQFEDEDGCPDALAELTDTHIQINGFIYFDVDSNVIQQRSMAIVDDVARILEETPDITIVEVAGHTDTRALDDYNLSLSRRRALSVRDALVSRGIEESRLTSRGYGETELADLGTTDQAHQRNRRVEFRIMERAEPAAEEK
jgi:outer membrane protein OmpA-like peptidoglycan-associated protein